MGPESLKGRVAESQLSPTRESEKSSHLLLANSNAQPHTEGFGGKVVLA